MIVIRLKGRLGNQLFIYAAGRALQEKYQQELVIIDNINDTKDVLFKLTLTDNIRHVRFSKGHQYDYYSMKAKDYEALRTTPLKGLINEKRLKKIYKRNHVPTMNVIQSVLFYLDKTIARLVSETGRYQLENRFRRLFAHFGILYCENGYVEYPKIRSRNIFLYGYFQSELYFKDIKQNLKREILPKAPIREEIKGFISKIMETESVCLSIRMGDYLNNPVLGVCTHSYYQKAIDLIYEHFPHAVIFAFSDDAEGVKHQFHFKQQVIFEPAGSSEEEKLYYMSQCRHFILSNSSFSWWAQYLSGCQYKLVIAPKQWYATEMPCDIYQDNWHLIDTK